MKYSLKKCLREIRGDLAKRRLYWRGQKLSRKMPLEKMDDPIDFVVAWVDGSDPNWVAERNRYAKEAGIMQTAADNGEERYRDWEIFKYWFRAVEKYAPWVRNVYLVTCGQTPEWLDPHAPKLKLINHTDYIPEEYLPVFNSIPIELNMHRIKGLGEHFVYFNDDMFLAKPVEPEDFFRGGKPNYTALALPLRPDSDSGFYHMLFSGYSVANRFYGNQIAQAVKEHPECWFAEQYGSQAWKNMHVYEESYIQGMVFPHLGVPFRKSTMERAWADIGAQLRTSSFHRFRTPKDCTHQIFTLWEMIDGEFFPVSREHHGKLFWNPIQQKDELMDALRNPKYRMICINDSELITKEAYLQLKEELQAAFAAAFPEKSSFEK